MPDVGGTLRELAQVCIQGEDVRQFQKFVSRVEVLENVRGDDEDESILVIDMAEGIELLVLLRAGPVECNLQCESRAFAQAGVRDANAM